MDFYIESCGKFYLIFWILFRSFLDKYSAFLANFVSFSKHILFSKFFEIKFCKPVLQVCLFQIHKQNKTLKSQKIFQKFEKFQKVQSPIPQPHHEMPNMQQEELQKTTWS